MEVTASKKTNIIKKRDIKSNTIYAKSLITKSIPIPIINVGKGIQSTLEQAIALEIEGKCIVEGFVKPDSVKIITFSSGIIKGTTVVFEVVFECETCCPVEGMTIECVAKNITKAGIRAESVSDNPSPVIIFITRDHHYSMPYFSEIKEGDTITVSVIGQRFELNDKYVSIIATLINPNKNTKKTSTLKKRSKLVLTNDEGKGIYKDNNEEVTYNTIVDDSSDDE